MSFLNIIVFFAVQVVFATTDDSDKWCEAVKKGDTDTVAQMLSDNPENLLLTCNYYFSSKLNALHIASIYDQKEVLNLLIDAGADVNAKDNMGFTPLHGAADGGSAESVKVLIDAGADVNAKDLEGTTPLHYAVIDGSTESVKVLIDAGADVNAKNSAGFTPLNYADYYRSTEKFGVLIDAGADVNSKGNDGSTLLHKAAEHGSTESVGVLIIAGADVEARDEVGHTALDYANKNNLEIICLLNVAGRQLDFVQLLNCLNKEDDIEFIHELLKSKKVLPMSVRQNNVDNIELLIEHGKEVEIHDSSGAKTPLYWALLNCSMEVLQMKDVDWNAQLQYDQAKFNPISVPDVVLETTELPNAYDTEKFEIGSNVNQDEQPEVVYCTDLTPGLKRFASGIDITTLDLFPLDSIKLDGFKKPLVDYTCNKGRNWRDGDNVFDIPDQIDALQKVSTNWTHGNVEIFRSHDEVKMSMANNVHSSENEGESFHLKTPRISIRGFGTAAMDWKIYEKRGSFSRTHSVRKMSEAIEKHNKTLAKATSFRSIYKAMIDTKSILEPNQRLRSAIDDLPLSVSYRNMHLYMDFIEEYGTHYFTEAKFGGYLMHLSAIDSKYASKFSDKHLEHEESTAFREKITWLNDEDNTKNKGISNDQEKAHEEFSKNADQEMYCYGGDPNAKNLDWFETVSGSPWLFSGKLEPIFELIENEQKQQSMKIALVAYLNKGRAAELGPRFNAEVCAFAFGDGCSAPRDNCAGVNQWSLPVTFREGTGSECRMNWKLKVASPDNWIEQRVKLCFKYTADMNSNCSGSDYHPSWRIETPNKIKTILSNSASDKDTRALINCADVNEWTSNYIHYNGEGCTMTWSMFAVGDEADDIPEWMEEFYFCWRTLTLEGKYTIDCAPAINHYVSHFSNERGQVEGSQMQWGLFLHDWSTEN